MKRIDILSSTKIQISSGTGVLHRHLPHLLLGGLVLVETAINVLWLRRNVTPFGRDSWSYLDTMLAYTTVFADAGWDTFFELFTYHEFRPPLLWLSALPLALLSSGIADGATFVNTLYLIAALLATYALGAHLGGRWTGLFTAFLFGTFPMLFGLSRLFYAELCLTALVGLNLYFLVSSDGFSHRRATLLWGLTLGLGMLAKWTMPAFVGPAALVVLLRADLLSQLRRQTFRIEWRTALYAVAGGLLISLLWVLPAWTRIIETRTLGRAILPLTWLSATLALYTLSRARTPAMNFVAGSFLALLISGFWYYSRFGFIDEFTAMAYIDDEPQASLVNTFTSVEAYVYYLRFLVQDIVGPLYSLLLLPALWPWLRGGTPAGRRASALAVWAGLLGAYAIFTFSVLRTDRMMIPLLPMLAVVAAYGLMHLRPMSLRNTWIGLVIGVGMLQFVIFSFDGGEMLENRLSALAPFPMIAEPTFALRPASGASAPGFAIAPDVLQEVADRTKDYSHPPVLGILVNSPQIHTSVFRYYANAQDLTVDIENLGGGATWAEALATEWLLTKNGDNHDVDPPGLRTLDEIYNNQDGLFPLLFEPVTSYTFPNGETATLWRRTVGPAYFPSPPPELEPLAQRLHDWLGDNPLLLSHPNQALWLGLYGLAPDRVSFMENARPKTQTVFTLLYCGDAGAPDAMARLTEQYYPAQGEWFDTDFLQIWGRPTSEMQILAPATQFNDTIVLDTVRLETTGHAGQVLPLELTWSAPVPAYKISVRLLDGAGEPITQVDRELASAMGLGLYVPPDTAAGKYTLSLRVYDPQTLEPVPAAGGKIDIALHPVTVRPSQ